MHPLLIALSSQLVNCHMEDLFPLLWIFQFRICAYSCIPYARQLLQCEVAHPARERSRKRQGEGESDCLH